MAQVVEELNPPKAERAFKLLRDDISEKEKEDLFDLQMQRFRDSRQYMEKLYPHFIKMYKRYRSIADPLKDDLGKEVKGRANIYIPYPWAVVESELPRLAGRLPRVRAFPRKSVSTAKVESIQDLIYYSFDRMNYIKLQTLWMRQHAIYGLSPLFYWWKLEKRAVLERKIEPTPVGEVDRLQKVEKIVMDDFSARVIDVFDSFLQPGVERAEEGDWFIFREWVSLKDIERRVEGGILYKEALTHVRDNMSPNPSQEDNAGRRERDDLLGVQRNVSNNAYGKHELMWIVEDDKIDCILNRSILARSGDNPEPRQIKPIITLSLMPLVSEPIEISTVDSLGGLPDKLNALSNTRLDNLAILTNKVVLANRFSQTDFSNLRFTAGNVILTDNIESSVKFLDVPDVGASSEREVLTTKEEMQFVSGVSDFIVGVKSSSRIAKTATGVSTIVREANARFALKLATFEGDALRRLVEACHAYNMTYMPHEKQIFVLGPKGYEMKTVKIDEILCGCDFIVEPGSVVPLDQQSRREALTNLFGIATSLPQIVDLPKLVKEVFASHDIRNPGEFLVERDELPQQNDVRLAEAENIALMQGQDIELKGNDNLHLSIHSAPVNSEEWDSWSPDSQERLMSHIEQHNSRLQQREALAQQASQTPIFGGMNAGGSAVSNTPRISGENSIFGGNPGVESPTRILGPTEGSL